MSIIVRDVTQVLCFIKQSPTYCVLENRKRKYMFGTKNYGDIPAFKNPADNDAWDVFAPGYERSLTVYVPYTIKSVLGYLRLSNGNHKIAVRLDVPGYKQSVADEEISRYCRTYLTNVGRHNDLQGAFVWTL